MHKEHQAMADQVAYTTEQRTLTFLSLKQE
jgi:hypothetical protein